MLSDQKESDTAARRQLSRVAGRQQHRVHPKKTGHGPMEWIAFCLEERCSSNFDVEGSTLRALPLERFNTTMAMQRFTLHGFHKKVAKVFAGPARPVLKCSTGSEGLCFRLPLAETVGIPYCTGKLSRTQSEKKAASKRRHFLPVFQIHIVMPRPPQCSEASERRRRDHGRNPGCTELAARRRCSS